MVKNEKPLSYPELSEDIQRLFRLTGEKIDLIERDWDPGMGTPVFTIKGKYSTRGWTEWTQGFLYGNAILQFDATGEERYLDSARKRTVEKMAVHVGHFGVHDHGFNNLSTYGNLLRLMGEGRIPEEAFQRHFYELALKLSASVQLRRWTDLPEELGYVASFNGPHSLFADTIRSMRVIAVAHLLGHLYSGEQDRTVPLLRRFLQHSETTARYNVYFGKGRDSYDVPGRVVHESIFNVDSGAYRCPSSQQGYSPFTTWTRGLAWIILGYAEELEFLEHLSEEDIQEAGLSYFPDKASVEARFEEVARVCGDFYIENTPSDGIPYWDTGAPGLAKLGNYLDQPAQIDNPYEPVDSSAAAIAAQGLLRLGHWLESRGRDGGRYTQAGLRTAKTLLSEDYLSLSPDHQGILLHSIYHRPNGWDYIPPGKAIPMGESSLWGDYHLMELGIYLTRLMGTQQEKGLPDSGGYYTFFRGALK